MTTSFGRALATACTVAIAIACGSSGSDGDSKSCAPGASVSCTGPGVCSGYQVCMPDGSGYGACDCGGTGGAGGNAGAAGAAGATSSVCPTGLKGPALIEVKAPNGTRYCIDATEVTFAQYDELLAVVAEVDLPELYPLCQNWLLDYNVHSGGTPCMSGVNKKPDAPARCVDRCGAVAYCQWAGKRLCGRIGGGPADYTTPADANVSQWFNACSAGGTQTYANGNVPIKACNDSIENIGSADLPAECQGSVPGLYGMSSNAEELEDACIPGGLCYARERDFSGEMRCDFARVAVANKDRFRGFRCCHDGMSE